MNLSKEQLKNIKEMASRLIKPSLIAISLGVDEIDFLVDVRDSSTPVHKAYYEGFIQAKIYLNESIIKSAKNGSNPAQSEMLKLVNECSNSIGYGQFDS